MINNIKSLYFIQIVFNFLEDKKKLKIVKYTKSLQKSININLIKYKELSGRYICYISKGKGREYNDFFDDLIFEGEYLNGERNGKGIEYYYDRITKFEGEYLKGKRHGKGKEYYYNEKLIYEGEYLNGERHGKGKEYYYIGNIHFDGDFLKGKKWNDKIYDTKGNIISEVKEGKGFIKEYNIFGYLIYEGEYLNGERHGKGKEYYKDHLIYEG